MRQDEFLHVEKLAVGGERGGAYLDQIGKFDLSDLSQDEYRKFCQEVIAGYRVAMAPKLRLEVPF